MIALSAATAGIAAAGTLSALRSPDNTLSKVRLAVVFALFASIVSLPLIVAFARPLYVYYLPMILPMFLTLTPAIYLYVAARASEGASPAPDWRHGVLPAAGLFTATGYWLLPAAPRAMMFVDGEMPPGLAPQILALATFALIAIWSLISFGYLIAALKRLKSYRSALKNLYSNTERRELRWIEWFMGSLGSLWAIVAATLVSDNFGPRVIFSGEFVLAVTAVLLLFLIAFSMTPFTIEEKKETLTPAPAEELQANKEFTEKYARSGLSPEMADDLAARIETAMQNAELYLDPNLSLRKLSTHVRATPNAVSQTLNERLKTTFFDYIARWRIKAAQQRMMNSDDSILQIAYGVGFNSRSTFYKAFKQETGMTPKAFRENAPHNDVTPRDTFR